MSRTTIGAIEVARAGVSESLTKIPTDGLRVINDGKLGLRLVNTHSADVVVTIPTPITVDGLAVDDLEITLQETGTAGDIVYLQDFPPQYYNQPAGYIHIDADVADVVDVQAYHYANAS